MRTRHPMKKTSSRRRLQGWLGALCLAGAILALGVAHAQRPMRGYWTVPSGDSAHNGWQKAETKITPETVAGQFKFLWKLKLGKETNKSQSFNEPLIFPFLITSRGFKDMALWGDSNTLYSVDYELGTLIWQKEFNLQSPRPKGVCGGSNIRIVMEPPPVIHFGAPPPPAPQHAPSALPPSPPPPPTPAPRRVGAVPAGGTFGLKGIYVLTGDGYLHEQILANGQDYAPAVKFLPAPGGNVSGLNIEGKSIYTETRPGCRNLANAAWSVDLSTPDYTVNSYKAQKLPSSGLEGPAIGADGTVYVETGAGTADPAAGFYPNSVVALTAKDLKVKDWYAPSDSGKDKLLGASPVVVPYKDKELIAGPGKDGSIVLLDSGSLGGPDHHTPLAETAGIAKEAKSGAWDSFASWQDKTGTVWVLASISGTVEPDVKFANTNGSATHGSIVAFKVEEKDGRPALTPVWISRDLMNPAPPAIANGVVFALAGGRGSTHATLYALDAATGKELYSSGDAIQTYTHVAGMSIGGGHVLFVTHDNTLYSFGIPMEH